MELTKVDRVDRKPYRMFGYGFYRNLVNDCRSDVSPVNISNSKHF